MATKRLKYFYWYVTSFTVRKCTIVKRFNHNGDELIVYKWFWRYWHYEIIHEFEYGLKFQNKSFTVKK